MISWMNNIIIKIKTKNKFYLIILFYVNTMSILFLVKFLSLFCFVI